MIKLNILIKIIIITYLTFFVIIILGNILVGYFQLIKIQNI